jgi:hypothetical protein
VKKDEHSHARKQATTVMNNLLIHPSIARGAANTTLREAYQEFEGRLKQLRDHADVDSESTARHMRKMLHSIASDRLVFLRTELAKKRSSIFFMGLDVQIRDARRELMPFTVLSGEGKTNIGWLRFKITQHAVERVQERRLGAVFNIASFADEFAPALLAAWASDFEAIMDDDVASERLPPTSNGALIIVMDLEWKGWIGVTWVAAEQLRPEQNDARKAIVERVHRHLRGLQKGRQRKTFAGRNDSVELLLRTSANFT